MKEKCISPFLLDLLTCPKGCDRGLQISMECDSVERGELLCPACKTRYPVISGIPVLFPDKPRCDFTIDKSFQFDLINKVRELEQKIRYLNRDKYMGVFASQELESLAWEYFHWQSWDKRIVDGTMAFDKEKIREILKNDAEAGGRLRFFKLIGQSEGTLNGRVILNVGAGTDLLYEEFTDAGACVVEQDIVLDSLLALKKRGALGICCDLRSLPIKKGSVDVITSLQVIHHVYPIGVPVKEMSRVLRNGGGLYINEPSGWALPTLMRQVMDIIPSGMRAAIVKKAMPITKSPSPHEKSIKPKYLLQILNETKAFSKIEIMHIHQKKKNMQTVLRAIDSMIVKIIPVLSSHIALYARKSNNDIEGH